MASFDGDSVVDDENNTIIRQNCRQTIAYINTKEDGNNPDKSIKIIERQSQPELLLHTTSEHSHVPKILSSDFISTSPSNAVNNPPWRTINKSSIKIENLVDKLHLVSSNNEVPDELNSTLEIVDHILNTAPGSCQNNEVSTKTVCSISELQTMESEIFELFGEKRAVNISTKKIDAPVSPQSSFFTPEKNSVCKNLDRDVFSAPSYYDIPNTPKSQVFKTPTSASSLKKPCGTSSKKTPVKSNVYQHITSPVASYIKNCPRVPLLKVVRPNKPLPATTIPKAIKSTPLCHEEVMTSNKENIINLPAIAYRSAVKTTVVDVPERHKLPSQSAKKITSSLPKPVIMKHNHREMPTQHPLLPHTEDSFANLSYHQADVSVCTRKTAFNKSSFHVIQYIGRNGENLWQTREAMNFLSHMIQIS